MVRDRDHLAVSRRARQDARRLRRAWDNYAAKTKALTDIRQCPSVWPHSLQDVAPTQCQLLEGHVQDRGTRHRHRMLGTQATVEWD